MLGEEEKEQKENEKNSGECETYYAHFTGKQKRYLAVRSVFDRILAVLAIILLSPLLLIICIAQKISAPGEPIFFLQKRVGQNARYFNIIKFRTMKSTAPRNIATGELENPDMYISRLGRFLRETSMDELPQLFNVVRNEMSIIGPRPLVYTEQEIHLLRRWYGIYQVKPGITGWAQINGRDTVNVCDKLFYDCVYVQNVGLRLDAKVLLKSIPVVLGHKGIVDGKVDQRPQLENIVLLRENKIVYNKTENKKEMDKVAL